MSNWPEREEAERFEAWCESIGVDECTRCGALVRSWDEHMAWHERLPLLATPFGGALGGELL